MMENLELIGIITILVVALIVLLIVFKHLKNK